MTISTVLAQARRWWWILILGPLLAAGTTYLISSAMTPMYQSNLTLLVAESQVSSDSTNYNDVLAAERRTGTYSHLVAAPPVLTETIKRLGLPITQQQLAAQVDVSPIRDTQLLAVSVTNPNPAQAAQIANTLGDVFIQQETQRQAAITGSSRDELEKNIDAVKQQIDDMTAHIAALQGQPDANSPSVQSEITGTQSQLSQARSTYSNLLEVQQRMALAESQLGSQIRVALPATEPSAPVTPRTTLNTTLGAVLGLIIAVGLVALFSYLDDTVKDGDRVQRLTGKPALGWIPGLRSQTSIEPIAFPHSSASDGYRSLRTNMQFATIGQKIRSIVITSSRPGDGKTSTVAHLGVVLAQGGQRVVIVDADLRKPRIHKLFDKVTNRTGLTDLLLADAHTDDDLESAFQETGIEGLRVITTGPLPPNPTDVLNSPGMERLISMLEAKADIVLFDVPPLAVSDALVVAGLADGAMLVALSGRTRSKDLARAVEDLARTSTPLLGVVLNRVDVESAGYYYYYQSYDEPDIGTPGANGSRPGAGGKLRRGLASRLTSRLTSAAGRGS